MGKKSLYSIFFFLLILDTNAQTGGDNVYEFLNLSHSALVSSLGGSNVSLKTDNLNLAYFNPALLTSEMDRSLALDYVNYLAGINYGLVMYSRSFAGTGSFSAGISCLDYGSFTESDASGIITGNFRASEYSFSVIYSRKIDTLFSAGINFKPVLSHLEKYTSFGLAFDIGGSFQSRSGLFSAGLVLRNIGLQVTTYTGERRQKLPFEIQAGLSGKLAHAPFRFSLTLRHLEKYDLTSMYGDTYLADDNQNSGFFENLLRHAIIGTEIIPHKNFYFSAGYNYQRRKELQTEAKISAVGFSWGFGINTSFMIIEFARAMYHLAGTSNNVSIVLRTDMIYKRTGKEHF